MCVHVRTHRGREAGHLSEAYVPKPKPTHTPHDPTQYIHLHISTTAHTGEFLRRHSSKWRLTDLGRQQAEIAGEWLRKAGF